MAEVYLSRLDNWLAAKQRHAKTLETAIAGFPGVRAITPTGPSHTGTFYAFVLAIDPDVAGFNRDKLLATIRRHGCTEFENCDSMRPLHTFPIFTAPRSPVTTYTTPLIREPLTTAAALAANTIRINVPATISQQDDTYITTAATALRAALAELATTAKVGA